jgi:hypothetical protein
MFQAKVNYRDIDGRTRDVATRGKTNTAAANNLRSVSNQAAQSARSGYGTNNAAGQ